MRKIPRKHQLGRQRRRERSTARRNRRVRRAAAGGVALTLLSLPVSGRAGAYPLDKEPTCTGTLQNRVIFDSASPWTPALEDVFLQSNQVWDNYLPPGYRSSPPTLERAEDEFEWDLWVRIEDLPDDINGRFLCSGNQGYLFLDESLPLEPAVDTSFEAVAAHELGHFYGLNHTDDGLFFRHPDTGQPIMSTCNSYRDWEQTTDDYAAWNENPASMHDDPNQAGVASADAEIMGPSYFEHEGDVEWAVSGGTREGFYLRPMNGEHTRIWQSFTTWGSGGREYQTWARYKDTNTSVAGQITFTMQIRRLSAPTAEEGDCAYINNRDLAAAYFTPGSSWTVCSTQTSATPDTLSPSNEWVGASTRCAIPSTWIGAGVLITAYKDTSTPLFVDSLHARRWP